MHPEAESSGAASESPRRLSVCVPTHHGRGEQLDELLTRLAAEPEQEQIEVCVSDNASRDGTAQIVARHRLTFGERLRYRRNERNVGWGENLLRAVELARSEYCWLMGSDDAPAPGSVARLLELIDEHGGTSGMHLGHLRVTPDLQEVGTAVAVESYPSQRATSRLRGPEEVGVAGYLTLFLSNNVVHRARWQRIAETERSRMLEFPLVPHMYMMGRIAALDPDWVWCPELLVISREGDIFLREPGEIGHDTRIVRQLIDELDHLWTTLHGRRSYVHRALMFKALRQMATYDDLLQLRIGVRQAREQVELLALTRNFWWSREYWIRSLPALLRPVGPLRYASGGPRRRASRRVAAHDRSVDISGQLPWEMHTGYATRLSVRVINRGSGPLSSAGPFAAWLACRWEDPTTKRVAHAGSPTKLWPPLRPEASRVVELSVTPPPQPGLYRLVIAPVEHYDGWYDADQSASSASSLVDVHAIPGRQPSEIVSSAPAQTRRSASGPRFEAAETLPGLAQMEHELAAADQIWHASGSRAQRAARTLRVLRSEGFDQALSTVEDPVLRSPVRAPWHPYVRAAALAWPGRAASATLLATPDGDWRTWLSRKVDAAFVGMCWDIAYRRVGPAIDRLEALSPPPRPTVRYRGRRISHQLAASALELATIADAVPRERLAEARTMELGGGYGRLALATLSLHPAARYVLIDLPPALAIAQRYVSEAAADRRIFRFRRFNDPAAVIDELLSSELAFLTPNQLALLPPLDADLWVSVSSLGGLSHEQLAAQFHQVDRHVSGWAYTQQWRIAADPSDVVAIEELDYPYPSHWRRVLERPHPIRRDRFEAIFETRPAAADGSGPASL